MILPFIGPAYLAAGPFLVGSIPLFLLLLPIGPVGRGLDPSIRTNTKTIPPKNRNPAQSSGASRTPPPTRNHTRDVGASIARPQESRAAAQLPGRTLFAPTTYPKNAIKNRNFASSSRRVLAPGRGQSVRSWILKGALAKRSCAARTQAPLSRAPRLGSSGTFLVLFWSQKSTPIGQKPTIKGGRRRVAAPGHLQPQSKIKQ